MFKTKLAIAALVMAVGSTPALAQRFHGPGAPRFEHGHWSGSRWIPEVALGVGLGVLGADLYYNSVYPYYVGPPVTYYDPTPVPPPATYNYYVPVPQDPDSSLPPPPKPRPTIEARLNRLQYLYDTRQITDEEYRVKRAQILQGL